MIMSISKMCIFNEQNYHLDVHPTQYLLILIIKSVLSWEHRKLWAKNEKNSAIVNRYELYHYTPSKQGFSKPQTNKLGNFSKSFSPNSF